MENQIKFIFGGASGDGKRLLGTGIACFDIETQFDSCGFYLTMASTCPKCSNPTETFTIARDWLTILFIPVFPLGISSSAYCISHGSYRVSLTGNSGFSTHHIQQKINSGFHYTTGHVSIKFRASWIGAFFYSLFGALLGFIPGFLLVYFLVINQALLIPVMTILGWFIGGAFCRYKLANHKMP